ncbi:RING finger and SPRY domain-containing protein 1-like [Planococcus citri]|uniref:RING finger and SPRY domain-containing protein 1-like n=1 Tax=Planococcus citri TaxID=170843 RepID=UPI0031F800DF
MGACQCKCCVSQEEDKSNLSAYEAPSSSRSNSVLGINTTSPLSRDRSNSSSKKKSYTPKSVDNLILQTLNIIGKLGLSGYNQEPPDALQKLHIIGDQEEGWLQIIISMINIVPVDDPLGPAVITVVLDDCPLPNKDTVLRLSKMLNLSKYASYRIRKAVHYHRNICVILGVLAEKLPGPSSVAMLTPGTLEYLITNLDHKKVDPVITLFSLIALEKFAQITENKIVIKNYLDNDPKNPLLVLENLVKSENYVEAQAGFCARWLLDNIFPYKGRKYSYLTADNNKLNAMLNTRDTSEYLKLSPDGIEARCDAYLFESVRCTFQINHGIWYYEATILSSGVMQIGWATINSIFRNHEGYGIGDDEHSISYDGCRQQLWYTALNEAIDTRPPWQPGDVVGCLINVPEEYVSFYLNGHLVTKNSQLFTTARCGFFAAASFMTFQHCRFNFGHKPFKYPPLDVNFSTFNDHGCLSESERLVLPRHVQFKQIQNLSILEDSCTLCFDNKATVLLEPCRHSGFCLQCSKQLTRCPVCRTEIDEVTEDETLINI